MLSPQEVIDCNGKGSCQGGEVGDVYGHAKTHGLVEEGCNNYVAVNGSKAFEDFISLSIPIPSLRRCNCTGPRKQCPGIRGPTIVRFINKTRPFSECDMYHRCGTCWPNSCDPIQNYTRYYIKDYGSVSGREKMMAEIHNRGPIACSIGCTPKFDYNYTGGIYMEYSDLPVSPNPLGATPPHY